MNCTHRGYLIFLLCLVAVFVECNSGSRVKRQQAVRFGFGLPPQGGGQGGQNLGGLINSFVGGLFGQNPNRPQMNPNQGRPQVNPLNAFNQFLGPFNQGINCNNNNGGCQQGCRMVRGRRSCYCNQGYVLNNDRITCSDIDECSFGGFDRPCQDLCTNTEGGYTCGCSKGALLPDGISCGQEENSCSVNNGGCEQTCRDKPNGGVRCRCTKGYEIGLDGRSCIDIDECSSGTHNCGSQVCTNTLGSFQCASAGLTQSCDIDNGGCQHRCRENRRGIRCRCRRGFALQADGKSCLRRNGNQGQGRGSCANNNGGCQDKCRDTRRGARCFCSRGFELQGDGKSCLDVDECSTGQHDCPEICINKPGSYDCTTAVEQAGCSLNNGGCEHRCRDTNKGVKCNCRKGFELQGDGKSCLKPGTPAPPTTPKPVNPCEVNNGGCAQLCENNNGAVSCQCHQGFTLVNGLCQRQIIPPPTEAPKPTLPPPKQRSCGTNTKKSLFRRIVGGRPADPKDWPWMAAILRNTGGAQFCGGTLISETHVLTAAHCVVQFTKDDIKVRLGEYNFDTPDENNPTDFRVVDVRMHSGYSAMTQENDIAILKLGRPTTFSEFIWEVCLPPPNHDFEDQLGYVTGWGTIYFGGPVSNVLQEVVVPVWKQAECDGAYPGKVFPTMMCAGLKTGGKDSCQGDSGGPYLVQIFPDSTWYIAGIVSWGVECASANKPGVYTRVNMYLDWIQQNTL